MAMVGIGKRVFVRNRAGRGWAITVAVVAIVLGGCATTHAPAPPPPAAQPVPADSPLAKIKPGMGMKEVTDLIGQPTDTNSHITGMAFIPFYFGEDRAQTVTYYKGLGRVIYSSANGSPRVSSVEYDPNETGYTR
jgi:hypothetical protein